MEFILNPQQKEEIRASISTLIQTEIKDHLNRSNINSPYLNKKQTCAYLDISNNTLDKWINEGFPTIQVGGVMRFDKHQIQKWMNDHTLEN
ncbi:TPA: helix-turn-helix domain-containing protein [Streptococcus suis]